MDYVLAGDMAANYGKPIILKADWDWADERLQSSELYELVEDHLEESEFIPETGDHVYQLDTGDCVVVTQWGQVIMGEDEDRLTG
jgi:hypothetical protein